MSRSASAIIWDWRGRNRQALEQRKAGKRAQLRKKGVIQGIIGLVIGFLIWRFLHPLPGQVVMGIAAALSIPVYLETFGLTAALMQSLADHPSGYLLYNVARYGICLLVMLPAAICAGSTVPLITGALLRAGVGERSIGQVYGANTVGSVLGVAVSGYVQA